MPSPAPLSAEVALTQVVSSRSRPSFPPAVVLPGFAFPTVGPLGLGSPPSQSAPQAADCRYYAPLRLPVTHLAALHSSLRPAIPCLLPPDFVCPVLLGSLCGEVASAQRQVSFFFIRLTSFPIITQGDNWLSRVPVLPAGCMPCSSTPVVLPALALTRRSCCLPTLATGSAFPPSAGGYPPGPRRSIFSGLNHTACFLATPGLVPTITDAHAGSLLSCWLGFAQVGLGANLTHSVTATSFCLAPSPRHGLCSARRQKIVGEGTRRDLCDAPHHRVGCG